MNGYGRAQYSNGDVYEGYFKGGDMHGLGLYHQREAHVSLLANFTNNKIAEQIKRHDNVELADFSFSKKS